MLYNRTATLYTRTISATRVKSYIVSGTINCNIQPITDNVGLNGSQVYSQYNLYTNYMNLKEGDKLVVDGETYIVNGVQDYHGTRDIYLRCMVDKSKGE